MNDADKSELNELKQRQQSLEHQFASLAADIRRLEARASREGSPLTPPAAGP